MANISLDIDGDKELQKALGILSKGIQRRTIKTAMRASMSPVNKASKRIAKGNKRTGQLWRSLGILFPKKQAKGELRARIWPRKGFKTRVAGIGNVDPRNYAHLVERGFQPRTSAEKAAGVKGSGKPFKGIRFFSRAMDENRGKVLSIMNAKTKQGIERETERARRKSRGKR